MVAIVSGNSLGLSLGSLAVLGGRGAWGGAASGRAGEGVYVNAASGNLVLQRRDESVMARGLDIAAVRTYNSQGRFNDDNGDNWSMGIYAQQLQLAGTRNAAGSSLVRTDRDGAEASFQFDAGRAVYVSTAGSGAYDTIAYDAAKSQYVWSDGDSGVQERYDAANFRLLSSKDPSGNTLTYAYNPAGLLASVSDGGNEQTFYDYAGNSLSQIRTVYQSGGAQTLTRTRYAYDASNRLSSVMVDLSPADNAIDDGRTYVTRYTYDGSSRRVASVAQSDGTRLAFTYVQTGNDYRVASVQDALGRLTQLSYDLGSRRTSVTDPLGYVSRFDYDAAGQLLQVSAPASNGQVQTTHFAYTASGDVAQIVDGLGRAVDMTYDGNGNQVLQRDAAGNTVARTFDARNQLLTETVYAIADPDGAGPAQPGQGLTTRYVYDAGGKNLLRFVLGAGGRVSENVYDGYGQRTASVEYAGGVYPVDTLGAAVPAEAQMVAWAATQDRTRNVRTDYTYDFRGQLTRSTAYANVDAAGAGIADAGRAITQYVYDQAGLLLKTISGIGATTVYTYDGLGRRLASTDALGQTTLTQYDDTGARTSVVLASGLVATSIYDRAGQLVTLQQADAGAQVLATTRYAYDADGRLRMTTDATGLRQWVLYDERSRRVADVDANGSLVEYSYDEADRLTRSVAYATPLGASALASLTTGTGEPADVGLASIRPLASSNDRIRWRSYDAAGRLVRSVDPGGAVTELAYDGASRLTASTAYAGRVAIDASGFGTAVAGAGDRTERRFYDADGLLRGVLDGEGYLSESQYDAAGRLVASTRYAAATPAAFRAGGTLEQLRPAGGRNDQTEFFVYDGKGLLVASVDAEGYLAEKIYDADGNLTKLIRYATRAAGTPGTAATLATLRPASSSDDQVSTRTYDKLDRVATETNAEGTQTRYAYDSVGQLVGTTQAYGQAEVRTSSARYDLQGRLVGELNGEGSALLTGSQTQAQIDAVWQQYGQSYAYDAVGRRLSATDANGNKSLYYYDADGHLTHSIDGLGEVAERSYDGLGQLSGTRRYAARIGVATLATLTGGLQDAALLTAVATLRNDAADSRELYTYTAAGQLATSTDALDAVTRNVYDAFGELAEQTKPLDGSQTRTDRAAYDRRGLATGMVADSGPGGLNASTQAVYDAFGRVVRSVDANGNSAVHTFDRLGRMVQSIDRANGIRSSTYDAFDRVLSQTDANGQSTRYAYSTSARSLTVTTPEGIVVTTVHNRFGQTLSIKDGRANVTSYTYDRNGNLKTTKTPLATTKQDYDKGDRLIQSTDERGIVTTYTYDAANRLLTRQLDPGGATSGLALTTRYAWSAKGERISVTDPRGTVTTTSFDRKGRQLEQVVDPGGLALRTRWAYDAADRVLSVTGPTGALTRYTYDALGRRSSESIDPGGLNITRSYRYDGNGNVVGMVDGNQQLTRYTYDAMDRQVWSVDAAGDAERSDYDAEGRLTRTTRFAQATDVAGLAPQATSAQVQARVVASPGKDDVVARRYDKDGRLRFLVDGTGAVQEMKLDGNGNVVERIAYVNGIDLAGWSGAADPTPLADASRDRRLRIVYDALDRATYSADALGTVTQNTYDLAGNLTRQNVHAVAVASNAGPDKVANDASDRITVFTYDAAGRESGRTDAFGAVTLSQYDEDGNLVASTRYATLVGAGAAPASVKTSAADRVTTRVFDKANRQTHVADALGYVTRTTYDAAGRVASSTRYASAIARGARPDSAAASLQDRTDSFEYDLAGRLQRSTDALGNSELTTYDGLGNKLTFTNKKGSVWAYAYDAAGRLTTETSPEVSLATAAVGGNGALLVNDAGNVTARIVTRLSYDGLGNLASRTEAAGRPEQRTTSYGYDAAGRQIKVTYPPVALYSESTTALASNGLSGAASRTETAGQALTTTTMYDALGNAVANIDVAGSVSLKAYEAMGRVSYEVDGLGYVTGYLRNAFGESTAVTRYAKATALAATAPAAAQASASAAQIAAVVTSPGLDHSKDRLLLTSYDKLGRAALVTEPIAFTYDATTRQSGSAGKTTTNIRNAFGELTQTTLAHTVNAGLATVAVSTFYYYDLVGNQVGSVDALGYLTEKTFDAVSNLTGVTEYAKALAARSWTGAAHAAASADASDRGWRYTYDAASRKTSEVRLGLSYSTGGASNDGTTPPETTYGYDALGNLTRTTDALGASTYSYYDALGRVTAVAAPTRPGSNGVAAVTPLTLFRRDAYGNVVARIERAAGAAAATEWKGVSTPAGPGFADGTPSGSDRNTVSAYDASGHATQVTDAEAASRYFSYNARGQVAKSWQTVTDTDGARTTLYQAMQYDRIGQLTHTFSPGPAGATVTDTGFEYNGFGEVTRKGTNGNGLERFDYDNAGRLWRSNAGDGVTKVFLYDVLGRQTSDIRSAGGVWDRDLGTLATAEQVASMADTRRTDTQYDALGRATSQLLPQRVMTQGGLRVAPQLNVATVVTSPLALGNSDGAERSAADITLSWNSLGSLGSGDVRVEVWAQGKSGRHEVKVLSAEQGATQAEFHFEDGKFEGSGDFWSVTHFTVEKKDVTGAWQKVVDCSGDAGATGNTLEVAAPSDPKTSVTLQYRPTGTTAWTTLTGINFGDSVRYSAAALKTGMFDYRVQTLAQGQALRTSSSGTLSYVDAPLANPNFQLAYSTSPLGWVTWQSNSLSTDTFRYRLQGSIGSWSTATVVAPTNGGTVSYVDTSRYGAGTYEYELLRSQKDNTTSAYAHATGTLTVTAGTAAVTVPAIGFPNVTGIGIGKKTVGTQTVTGLYWDKYTSGTPLLSYRLTGTVAWSTLAVTTTSSVQSVSIAALPSGTYEFSLLYKNSSGLTVAAGAGTFTTYAPVQSGASTVIVQSQIYTSAVSVRVVGTAQYKEVADLAWPALTDLGPGDVRVDAWLENGLQSSATVKAAAGAQGAQLLFFLGTSDETVEQGQLPKPLELSQVLRFTVQKKDAAGNWQTVVDAAGERSTAGDVLIVPKLANAAAVLTIEARAIGSDVWQLVTGIDFGTSVRFADPLFGGPYEYRTSSAVTPAPTVNAPPLPYTPASVIPAVPKTYAITITTVAGTLSISGMKSQNAKLVSTVSGDGSLSTIVYPVTYATRTSGVLSWQAQPASIAQTLRYRIAGSGDEWSTLNVINASAGYQGVDTSTLASGTYEYELLWTRAGDAAPTAHALGTFTIADDGGTVSVPAVGSPNVGALTLGPRTVGSISFMGLSWDTPVTTDDAGTLVTTSAVFNYRRAGSTSWSTLAVSQADSISYVTLEPLPAGDWDFSIAYVANNTTYAVGTGTLKINAPGAAGPVLLRYDDVQVPIHGKNYSYGRVDGQMVIQQVQDAAVGRLSTLQFRAGIAPGDLSLRQVYDAAWGSNSSLQILINGTSDRLTLQGFYAGNDPGNSYNPVQQIKFADGTVWDATAVNALIFAGTTLADNVTGTVGNDVITGQAGNDSLSGAAGNDFLYGGEGYDSLAGGTGDDALYGGAGNDSLNGQAGNDTLDGGGGDDALQGEGGNNTYLFGRGDGQDFLQQFNDATVGRVNVLQLKMGIDPADILLRQVYDGSWSSNSSLEVSIAGTADKVTVQGFYAGSNPSNTYNPLQQIRFDDGTIWNIADINARLFTGLAVSESLTGTIGNDVIYGQGGNDSISGGTGDDFLYGGAGNDSLNGQAGNDTIDGGTGNDTLQGEGGNNVYLFGRGDGQDYLQQFNDATVGKLNTLQFKAGITASDIVLRQISDSLEISLGGPSGDKVTVQGFYAGNNPGNSYNPLQQIRFDDGTVWNIAAINAKLFAGTSLGESLTGTVGNDVIYGQGGNDSISGGTGDDFLYGGAGNDSLNGQAGNDTIDGGTGNDTLQGEGGNNVYLFGRGDGQDYLQQFNDATVGKLNTLQFKAGITASDIVLRQISDSLEISLGGPSGDKVTVQGFYAGNNPGNSYNPLQQIRFDDGTVWNIAAINSKLAASVSGLTLTGTAGNDVLTGGLGDDTINAGEGNDVIYGGAGNDYLNGQGGNDTLDGGTGNDSLKGEGGINTYLFGRGDGQDLLLSSYNSGGFNTLQFKAGVAPSDIVLRRVGDNLQVGIIDTSDVVTAQNFLIFATPYQGYNALQQIKFADGTLWDIPTILARLWIGTSDNDSMTGTSGVDTMSGGEGDDSLYGDGGNDVLLGGAGNDYLNGQYGDDTIDGGAGNDTLQGEAGVNTFLFGRGDGQDLLLSSYGYSHSNTLQFKAGVAPSDIVLRRIGNNLEVGIVDTNDVVTAQSFLAYATPYQSDNALQQIKFDDGTVWDIPTILAKLSIGTSDSESITGTSGVDTLSGDEGDDSLYGDGGNDILLGGAGNDYLNGQYGDDTLDGGAGDDTLQGEAGVNTFLFGRGDGQDLLLSGHGYSKFNTLQFKAGVAPSDIVLRRVGDNLELSIVDTNDVVTAQSFLSFATPYQDYNPLQQIKFADGTVWDTTTILAKLSIGTSDSDSITGTSGVDTLSGGDGDDSLYGNSGDDVLLGGSGNDYLNGQYGDDTIDGGAGNDNLQGEAGVNTFLFGRGDGQDLLLSSYGYSHSNTLLFKAGVAPSDIVLRRVGDNLEVGIVGTNDVVTAQNFFSYGTPYQSDNPLQQIKYADGTVWDIPTILAHVTSGASRIPSSILSGSAYTGFVSVPTAVYGTYSITTPPYNPGYTIPGLGRGYSSAPFVNGDAVLLRPTILQKFDRWGNVIETSDVRNTAWKTVYHYNADDQVISETRPTTTGLQTGSTASNPSTETYYDAVGHQVAVKDTLGHVNTQAWDAGSQLIQEGHADGGAVTYTYDALGNKTSMTDALGNQTLALRADHTTIYQYDRSGRLLATVHGAVNVYGLIGDMVLSTARRTQITETTTYDEAGRKIGQTDGADHATRYQLDRAGHITRTTRTGMAANYAAYDAYGHQTSATDELGKTATWSSDYFGRLLGHTDIGGHQRTYTYDNAGQLMLRRSIGAGLGSSGATQTQDVVYTYDAAGQLLSAEDKYLQQLTTYAYDLAGRHVAERTVQAGVTYQDNHLGYDALGQLRDVNDGRVHLGIDYDSEGNRTHITTRVNVGSQGSGAQTPGAFVPNTADDIRNGDRWFQYDAMNRQTRVDAVDAAGNIGEQGHEIVYDRNGNRTSDTWLGNRVSASSPEPVYAGHDEDGTALYVPGVTPTWSQDVGRTTEIYAYDALDRLTSTERDGMQVDLRFYDAAGNAVQTGRNAKLPAGYADELNKGVAADGAIGLEKRKNLFDAAGRLVKQRAYRSDSDNVRDDITYDYDAAGNVKSYTLQSKEGAGYSNTYAYGMVQAEGYLQQTISAKEEKNKFKDGSTRNDYDLNGYLVKVTDQTQAKNSKVIVNDIAGHALALTQNANMTQRQLVVNGQVLGRYGMATNPITPRNDSAEPNFSTVADFNFGYQPINGNYPTASAGSYTVRAGDTLASIAQGAYGDQQMWWRIAEVNNLSGDRDLRVGQTLTVPNKVGTVHNSAESFKPYDPSKVVGDTTPNMAPPDAAHKGCGGLGLILVVVVAAVVTVYTAGLASGASGALISTFEAGATALGGGSVTASVVGGIAGSIVSQGVGIAVGVQDKFSWKQVALSAVSAGTSSGVASALPIASGLEGAAQIAAVTGRAAVTSAVMQGLAVAVGLQDKFSWKGIAASAVAAGVGEGVHQAGSRALGAINEGAPASDAQKLVVGTASGFAAGVTRAALGGGRINVQQIAVDAFGNALGESIGGQTQSPDRTPAVSMPDADKRIYNGEPDWSADSSSFYQALVGAMSNPRDMDRLPGILLAAGADFKVDISGLGWTQDFQLEDGTVVLKSAMSTDDARRRIADLPLDGETPLVPGYSLHATEVYERLGVRDAYYMPNQPSAEASKLQQDFRRSEVEQMNAGVWQDFQGSFEQRVAAGTYNRYSEIDNAWSAGRYDDVWRHLMFDASDSAKASLYRLRHPPVDPTAVRLDQMISSPIGAVAWGISHVAGASERVQDGLLATFSAAEKVAGARTGVYKQTLTAKAPIPGTMAARPRSLPAGYMGPNAGPSLPSEFMPPNAGPQLPRAYSVLTEFKLSPSDFGRSRKVHFNRANAGLDGEIRRDSSYGAVVEAGAPGTTAAVSRIGGRETPPGFLWEHASSSTASGQVGVLRLVPVEQHTPGSPFWRVIHPDPRSAGGYAEWAIPAGAPPNRK